MDTIKEIPIRELLYEVIPKNGIGAELGVCRGSNAVQLFFKTKPSIMFLVDTWEEVEGAPRGRNPNLWLGDYERDVKNIFEDEINQGKVFIHREFSTSFLSSLPDDFLDWVYIDTNHHYQCISREIDLSVKKVRKGGYIMGHDYFSNPQVWGTSIIRAVNERIQNGDIIMEAITNEVWPTYLTKVL
jgi:hypothetical protein